MVISNPAALLSSPSVVAIGFSRITTLKSWCCIRSTFTESVQTRAFAQGAPDTALRLPVTIGGYPAPEDEAPAHRLPGDQCGSLQVRALIHFEPDASSSDGLVELLRRNENRCFEVTLILHLFPAADVFLDGKRKVRQQREHVENQRQLEDVCTALAVIDLLLEVDP